MSSLTKRTVFISYCHSDAAFSVPLIEKLRHTFDDDNLVFDPAESLRNAPDRQAQITAELARCAAYLVVLSPEALRSTMVMKTIEAFVKRRTHGSSPVCIPLLRIECHLPSGLHDIAYISFQSPERSAEAYARLVRTLRDVIRAEARADPVHPNVIDTLFSQGHSSQWKALLPAEVLAALRQNTGAEDRHAPSAPPRTPSGARRISDTSKPLSSNMTGERQILEQSFVPYGEPNSVEVGDLGDICNVQEGASVARTGDAPGKSTFSTFSRSYEQPEHAQSRHERDTATLATKPADLSAHRGFELADGDDAVPAESPSETRAASLGSHPAIPSLGVGGSVRAVGRHPQSSPLSGMRQLICPVDFSDHPSWRCDPGYSSRVAEALGAAYSRIRRHQGTLGTYLNAYRVLRPCLGMSMSSHQFINVNYALAMSYAAVNDTAEALKYLDDALEQAVRLSDLADVFRLAYLHGVINFGQFRLNECISQLSSAREILDRLGQGANVFDPALELDLLLYLSLSHFLLADFSQAEQELQNGAQLVSSVPNYHLYVARSEWIIALLHTWRGQSSTALHRAMKAAKLISSVKLPPPTYGRIGILVADIALDIAKAIPTYTARRELLNLANIHSRQALAFSRAAGDAGGEGLALLAVARHARESGGERNGVDMVEMADYIARRTDDHLLLSQVYTERGDSFAARGEIESMYNCYRSSLVTLERSEANAYKVKARRALLGASEMHL